MANYIQKKIEEKEREGSVREAIQHTYSVFGTPLTTGDFVAWGGMMSHSNSDDEDDDE